MATDSPGTDTGTLGAPAGPEGAGTKGAPNGRPAGAPVAERLLVARAKAGDREAFAEIFREYLPLAHFAAHRILKCHDEARDIAQEVMIRVHRSLPGFRHDSTLKTWIFRIAFNLGRNRLAYLCRRGRETNLSIDHVTETLPDMHEKLADDRESPAEEAESAAYQADVVRARASLQPTHREILELRIDRQMDYLQIAAHLDIDVGTIKSRLSRARERLRNALKAIQAGMRPPIYRATRCRTRCFVPPRTDFLGPPCGCGRVGNHFGQCAYRRAARKARVAA